MSPAPLDNRDILLRGPRALSGGGAITILVALALLRDPVLFQSPFFSCAVRCLVSFSPVLAPFGVLIFSALVLRSLSGRFTISIRLSLTGGVRLALLTGRAQLAHRLAAAPRIGGGLADGCTTRD